MTSKGMWAVRGMPFAVLLAVMVALVLGYAAKAYAAPGYLDPSFGSGGDAITDFGSHSDMAYDVALQEDGKVILAGHTQTSTTGLDFALARYNPNGTLDASFGSGGKVTTPIASGTNPDTAQAVAVRADGKIVVAGSSDTGSGTGTGFAVVRYNPNGTLDTSFGSGGKVITFFGSGGDYASGLAVQGNKVLVVGETYNSLSARDFALVRYDNNGALDSTFGSGGVVKTDFSSGSYDIGNSVVVQEDGNIVVAGHTHGNFALARYTPSGALDLSFDADGKVTTHFGSGGAFAYDVAVQEDGKIVAAGYADNGSNTDFGVARYRTNGSLDGEFGSGGMAMVDFGSYDKGCGLALQDDGKMVIAGQSDNSYFALARLNDDGSADASFHNDGKLTTDIRGNDLFSNDIAYGVEVQHDGKIVAAGLAVGSTGYDFALARYYGGNDATPPNVKPPAQSLITYSTLGTSDAPVKLAWSATDSEGVVTDYDLQRSMDGGAYRNINLPSAMTTAVTHLLSPTHNYRYRVRATDDNGNRSSFKYGPRFTVDAHQEISGAIAYSGTWTRQSLSGAYGGAVKYATASGATSTLAFTGTNVAWVAPKSNTRGKAEVYLDGAKVATVDLYSSTALSRKVIYSANGLTLSDHALQIKVLGTKNASSSGTRVDVDAFVVLR